MSTLFENISAPKSTGLSISTKVWSKCANQTNKWSCICSRCLRQLHCWMALRESKHTLTYPVSTSSYALLALIQCAHPGVLTNVLKDSPDVGKHAEPCSSASIPSMAVKMTNLCKQAGSLQPRQH